LNTGKAHRETYKVLKIDPTKNEQLLPLVLYIDGSAVTHFHAMELIQVKVGLGILNRETRTKEYTWGILGYIEKVHETGGKGDKIWEDGQHMDLLDDLEYAINSDDEDTKPPEELPGVGTDKKQDFHAQVGSILQGLITLIATGIIWDLVWKGRLYKDVHWKIFVPYVKCDTQEADTLCSKYLARGMNVQQLCRYCYCPTQETDDHLHKCKYKTVNQVTKLVEAQDFEGLHPGDVPGIPPECILSCPNVPGQCEGNSRGLPHGHAACFPTRHL
jgi:hypothetical protein